MASEQADIEKQIHDLQEEVNHQDECIKQLQKQFKDAENLLVCKFQANFKSLIKKINCTNLSQQWNSSEMCSLFQSTAVYQAKQKLDSIGKAKQTPVNSEDLIRYAHRISASNAVCAPLNWEQGDPRRPYPTGTV